jgi:hypothetical protein
VGLVARRSRWRANSIDNHGGFMLVDRHLNAVVAGERFNMTAEQVVAYCQDDNDAGSR